MYLHKNERIQARLKRKRKNLRLLNLFLLLNLISHKSSQDQMFALTYFLFIIKIFLNRKTNAIFLYLVLQSLYRNLDCLYCQSISVGFIDLSIQVL